MIKRLLSTLSLLCLLAIPAMADQATITQEGAFEGTIRRQVNANFTELYASTNPTGFTTASNNPLMRMTGVSVPIASVNIGYTFIAAQSGLAIVPNGGFTVMASGTATTATAIGIYCSSGNTIATFPIAMLTTGKPVGPFASAANGTLPTLASSLTRGCIAGDSVYISNTGSAAAGATHIMINFPYGVATAPIQ
jgi:hypothetical protein